MLNGKNVIEEFYYGNLDASEGCFRLTPEYIALQKAADKKEDELTARLDDEQAELFNEYIDAMNAYSGLENQRHFMDGWTLAAHFMLDTFLVPWYAMRQG